MLGLGEHGHRPLGADGRAPHAPKGARQISLLGAQAFLQAAGFAGVIGVPLNRHLTISWHVAETIGRVQDLQREVLQLAAKWLRYHGVQPAFVWVVENGYVLGHHSHIAIHVPDHLVRRFRVMADRWVQHVGGNPKNRGAVRMTRDKFGRADYHAAIEGLLRYMLKGLELEAARLLRIEPQYDKAGTVIGKRCGFSESLGPTAQERHLQAAA